MKQVNIPLTLMVSLTLALLVLGGCGADKNAEFIPVRPDITSASNHVSFLTLEDDRLFSGDWGGIEFDGKNYRTLNGNGSIGFELPEPPAHALMLQFTLKTPAPLAMQVRLNGTDLKTVDLGGTTLSEPRILLAKQLLRTGLNQIDLQPSQPTALKFYSWEITPANLANKRMSDETFTVPARLDYQLWPHDDHLEATFDQPLKHIEVTVTGPGGDVVTRTFDDAKEVRLDLSKWRDQIISVSMRLRDKSRPVRLLSSGIRRSIPRPEDANLTRVQESLDQKFPQYNVLILLLDSARADRFSAYGYKRPTTPNIDRLAQSALVFTEAYSEAAYTLASTGSLFSGLAPDYHNAVSNYYGGLPASVETLAEVFQARGYHTGAVSAIPYCGSSFNMQQGFDTFIELFKEKKQPLAQEFLPHFERFIDSARQSGKKFFAYLHIREPHIDYLMEPPFFGSFHKGYESYPNEPYLKRLKDIYFALGDYQERRYSAEDIALLSDSYDENLLKADFEVNRILEALKSRQLAENTIVVILGDHGEGLDEHQIIGHNTILFREGLHIPMIIHIPGITESRTEIPFPVSTTDLTATLKQLAQGATAPTDTPKGLFKERTRQLLIARTIFFSRFYPFYAMQESHYRAIIPFPLSARPISMYDIAADPNESSPIENPPLREYFLFQLRNFFRQKNAARFDPQKTTLKPSEIESLKSLGYL